MALFKIYAGLGGGFGGAQYHGTYEYSDKQEAEHDAYNLAWEEYESYGGYHGLYTWDSMREEIANEYYDGDIDAVSEEEVTDAYNEEVEGWLVYKAIEVTPELDCDNDTDYDDDDADCFCD